MVGFHYLLLRECCGGGGGKSLGVVVTILTPSVLVILTPGILTGIGGNGAFGLAAAGFGGTNSEFTYTMGACAHGGWFRNIGSLVHSRFMKNLLDIISP